MQVCCHYLSGFCTKNKHRLNNHITSKALCLWDFLFSNIIPFSSKKLCRFGYTKLLLVSYIINLRLGRWFFLISKQIRWFVYGTIEKWIEMVCNVRDTGVIKSLFFLNARYTNKGTLLIILASALFIFYKTTTEPAKLLFIIV